MSIEQRSPRTNANFRQNYLSNPTLRLERFGREQFVGNLNAIQNLIVAYGESEHSADYCVWKLSTVRDGKDSHTGVMFVSRSSLKKRSSSMLLYKQDDKDALFGKGWVRLHISANRKIDIEVDTVSYPEAIAIKTAEESSGKSVELKETTVIIKEVPVKGLSRQTVDFLNSVTSIMLSKFQKFIADPRRESEPQMLPNLPTDTEDRATVLKQLRNMVRMDKGHLYLDRRHVDEYIRALCGVEATFNYLKTLGTSDKIVDVGAGFGEAILAIIQKYGKNLEAHGTNLRYDPNLIKTLGKNRVRFTPAEFMKGFENNSIAGIIAVASIAYSVAPKLVIQRLDDILVPGGVIKAAFRSPEVSNMEEYGFQTHHAFTRYLKELGYDVAIFRDCVVLAIKPGGKLSAKAKTLLEKDLESYKRSGLEKAWRSKFRNGEIIYHQIDPDY